jgi:hypothetical protein
VFLLDAIEFGLIAARNDDRVTEREDHESSRGSE